jgi:phytoene dehydrogenase-like protein
VDPFEDGSSLTQWLDEDRTAKEIHALAPRDVDGYVAYVQLFRRIRSRLRAGGDPARDTWIGDAPDRAALDDLFGDDPEAREVLFEASIADVVERHVRDERLRIALHGQGIIGRRRAARPGTA